MLRQEEVPTEILRISTFFRRTPTVACLWARKLSSRVWLLPRQVSPPRSVSFFYTNSVSVSV